MKNKFSLNLEVTLVEIILSVFIFAITGVISLNCFAMARFTQIKANDMVAAGNIIQSNVEMLKSYNSQAEAEEFLINNFKLMKSDNNVQTFISYYNKEWNLSNEADNEYFIAVTVTNSSNTDNGAIKSITLKAERIKSYPFINKNNQTIYYVETKKFFPSSF